MRGLSLISIIMVAIAAVLVGKANAATPPVEKEVVIGVSDAFVPSGFDAESDAYVVTNGHFPNGCYRWKRSDVRRNPTSDVIEVRSIATVTEGYCIMVMVPFTQPITLGKLGVGEHKVRFIDGNGNYMEKTVVIE